MHRGRLAGLLCALATLAIAPASAPAKDANASAKLRKAVTVNGIMEHERALQAIADRNDGTRASGTDGYQESVDYVAQRLRRAGYKVTVQPFDFPFFQSLATPTFERTSPTPHAYTSDEFALMDYSGSGDVTGTVVPGI